jgi:hypothetical protein
MRDPELSIAGWLLLGEAATLRERAFCRLIEGLDHDSVKFTHTPQQIFQIHPVESTLIGLITACSANTWSRDRLANIPIARAGRSALSDPELVPMLQDLANILAWEATQAFTQTYYPGVPDVNVPDSHVEVVMRALQREMDREGKSRQRIPIEFIALPKDRQRALAERRRWWFGKYSITPERWQTGYWSLWDVSNEEMPAVGGVTGC